jgi:hypothetical protein
MKMTRKAAFATVVMAISSVILAGAASATDYVVPADPTAGGGAAILGGIGTWMTTYGAPLIVGLVLLGALFGVFVRLGKKAKGLI